jgi:hypothetical protein
LRRHDLALWRKTKISQKIQKFKLKPTNQPWEHSATDSLWLHHPMLQEQP